MNRIVKTWWWLAAFCVAADAARAFIEVPYSLGNLVNEARTIVVLQVEKVDRDKNLIIYRKQRALKGEYPADTMKHNIGRGGFHPREWQTIMAWATPGQTAVFFSNGSASETCLDTYWYQTYQSGDWWNLVHGEPFLLRSYAGKADRLVAHVESILAGREVIVPCMVDGDKNALHTREARIQRVRASLALRDYNPKRDFVGWGQDEFRRVAGWPGISHIGELGRLDPGALGVATADFDGDGKPDFCLFGENKVMLLQNAGHTVNEVPLPVAGGARSADWGDFNGDGKPDLLLATPSGLKLLTNKGTGQFADESARLPRERYYNATAAAWLDVDGDRRTDILFANGFRGLRLYRNIGDAASAPAAISLGPWFYAGPFDNTDRKGFAAVYPPERNVVDLKAVYAGKNNEKVTWRAGGFTDGQKNPLGLFSEANNNNCAIYLYREMEATRAAELPVSLGIDDTITVWLNGEKLLSEEVYRACASDQHLVTLRLRPGKNHFLMKVCQGDGGFEFYFASKESKPGLPVTFADVSAAVGFGPGGVGDGMKGDRLVVADVNGDKRPDFLYSAGPGLLAIHNGRGFVAATDSGIEFEAGGVAPVFGDYNGDGKPDLFVPQRARAKLFQNMGEARFRDVTAASGDLAKLTGNLTAAAWIRRAATELPGLLVGRLRGHNLFLRQTAAGQFQDATEELGLQRQVFNSRAITCADVNGDGIADVLFVNERQDSVALLGTAR
jgi:hypothetical protein